MLPDIYSVSPQFMLVVIPCQVPYCEVFQSKLPVVGDGGPDVTNIVTMFAPVSPSRSWTSNNSELADVIVKVEVE